MAAKNKSTSDEILYVQTCLSDHRRDVAGMSAEQRGVYEALRVAYFQRGGPLPLDVETIYRLADAHTAKEKAAVRLVLDQKFTQEPDGYHSGVCDAELVRVRTKKLQARLAADARHNNPKPDANADADASSPHMQPDMRSACGDDANHKPITSNQKSKDVVVNKDVIVKQPSPSLKEGKGSTSTQIPGPNGPDNAAPPNTKPNRVGADIGDTSIHTSTSLPSAQPPEDLPPDFRPSCIRVLGADDIEALHERNKRVEAEREASREWASRACK